MPFVYGFLRRARRHGWRPGRPDIGLPDPEHPVDPDYGIEEGLPPHVGGGPILPEEPDIDPPDPPVGIWPPMHPGDAWRPVDPGYGIPGPLPPHVGGGPARPPGLPPVVGGGPARPERPTDPGFGVPEGGEVAPPIALPPGMIWPPIPAHGKWLALVVVFGMKGGPQYRYTVIDADLRPGHGLPRPPGLPDNTLPGEGAIPKPA